ncbi:MAG: hypothetical protein NTX28_09970 [Novosphingobium sp.]|nr:hypothetical protein [Novosphingobium sp.]
MSMILAFLGGILGQFRLDRAICVILVSCVAASLYQTGLVAGWWIFSDLLAASFSYVAGAYWGQWRRRVTRQKGNRLTEEEKKNLAEFRRKMNPPNIPKKPKIRVE